MAATYNDIPAGPQAVVAVGSVVRGITAGGRYSKRIRLTGSGSYVTGGYALPALNLMGMSTQVDYVNVQNQNPGATDSYWLWNTVTQKAQLIVSSTGAELAAAQNDGAAFVDLDVIGF